MILLALAGLVLISLPFIRLIFPVFYVQTFLYDPSVIVLFPHRLNFDLVLAASLLLFAGFIIPLIKQNKFTYSLLAVFVAGGIFVFYLSVLSYTYIGKEKIVSHNLFEGKSLEWTEIKEVALEYYQDDTGRYEEYNFKANDGNSIRIPLNNHFLYEDKSEIYKIARQNNVFFIELQKN